MREVLTLGRDLNVFGHLLHEAWLTKRSLEKTISNDRIDALYEDALSAGALGGNGGFLLFYCEPHRHDHLRRAMEGLTEIPFAFEREGSKVIYVGEEHW